MVATVADPVATSLDLIAKILPAEDLDHCTVCFWDGSSVRAKSERFRIHVNTPWALRAALMPPIDVNSARALATGTIELSGDVEAAIAALYAIVGKLSAHTLLDLLSLVLRLPTPRRASVDGRRARLRGRTHTAARDRAAITYHYEQPREFYETFLDERLVYSCGYFERDDDDLETAQLAKIDLVLRKLRLKPGQRLLDIGCGWGALLIRAVERFGATVFGVTLSDSQRSEAMRRIAERGLEDRAFVDLRDYRQLIDRGPYDAIVSVGMAEHVGRRHLGEYFSTVYGLLRPGGLFLNHAISDQSEGRRKRKTDAFIARYVFPDGQLVPIGETLAVAEVAGFEVRDVENLREHYHRTLRLWSARLDDHRDAAVRYGGEATFRIFRTYLAGSAVGFSTGRLGLHQTLLARPASDGRVDIPPTRRDLYLS